MCHLLTANTDDVMPTFMVIGYDKLCLDRSNKHLLGR